jgi:hypothetical protein
MRKALEFVFWMFLSPFIVIGFVAAAFVAIVGPIVGMTLLIHHFGGLRESDAVVAAVALEVFLIIGATIAKSIVWPSKNDSSYDGSGR